MKLAVASLDQILAGAPSVAAPIQAGEFGVQPRGVHPSIVAFQSLDLLLKTMTGIGGGGCRT